MCVRAQSVLAGVQYHRVAQQLIMTRTQATMKEELRKSTKPTQPTCDCSTARDISLLSLSGRARPLYTAHHTVVDANGAVLGVRQLR